MGWFTSNKQLNNVKTLKWISIKNIEQAKTHIQKSEVPLVFFKHSTRCSISSFALSRFEREWDFDEEEIIPLYIDLIAHRDVSDFLASHLNVIHQSPQILVVRNGKCIFNASHNAIVANHIKPYTQLL